MRPSLAVLAVLAGTVFAACADRSPAPESGGRSAASSPSPVLVFGVDGLEWSELGPLLDAGDLPVLAGLIARGRCGRLQSLVPSVSPVIWTTMATGKGPDAHGIRGFAATDEAGAVTALFNNHDRVTKAFWNILSDRGRRVAVIGWWMTYPVDAVNGLMVAQVNTLDRMDGPLAGGLVPGVPGQVHPPERETEILAVHDRVIADLSRRTERIFGDLGDSLGPLERHLLSETRWAFRADATYLEVARAAVEEPYDLVAVYLGGTDVVAHRFWRYGHPEEFLHAPDESAVAALGEVIADYYRYVDSELGRLLDAYHEPPTVLVLSDHGMHASNTRYAWSSQRTEGPVSGHHDDGPPGVAILSGPGIRPPDGWPSAGAWAERDLPYVGSVLDVTPTLLALLGLPVGRDMTGEIWWAALAEGTPAVDPVESHDDRAWREALADRRPEDVIAVAADERLAQLRSLGYLD